ncbi:hypothetical protein CRUP_029918 [Coryphaenoides rupestris]|nr:hypothetical protein CRUP_029918 [Coryphaenoides rupestris]
MAEANQFKDEGNAHFQAGEMDKAIESYSNAIKLCKDKKLSAIIYRNRSACYLKKENYTNAACDASKDIKALFRRCQALEKLGKLDMAFKDVQRCATLEPKNKTFLETLRRLGAEIQSKAANNLIVLAREDAGAERIFENNGVPLLINMIESGKPEMILASIRTLSGMCTGHKARTMAIIQMISIDKMCSIMAVDNEELAMATCNLFQCINDSLTCSDKRIYGKEEAMVLDASKDLKTILLSLLEMVGSKKVSGHGRDQALNLLTKNVPRKEKNEDHSKTLFTIDHGLKKILKVCGQIPDLPDQLPMTENTQLIASVLLTKLYDDLKCDPERDNFRDVSDEYIKSKFDPKDMDKNIHAINVISGLLQGPFDVGNAMVGRQGVMEMMVALCASDREVDQLVAIEALIHAASKMSRASFIITNGVSLLKDIYKKTKNEKIKIRTLVSKDKTILYAVACTLVNCTNSYDKKDILPELVQLAKFSKQHVPEQHPKDKKDFIEKRIKRMLKAGVTSALTVMVKADSSILTDQTKEMLSRVFLALSEDVKDRGIIVAQGGGKALIPLALEGTNLGKVKACHALAKIASVSNPEMAFPGERVYEVVRPLVTLLSTDRDGMENYEALKSLTNLAGFSEKLRTKIVKEKALPEIENYMFEDHDQIRQAATECMCNLVSCKESTQWLEILQRLCLHDNPQVQHRGLVIVYNMLDSDDHELAKNLMECELLEILSVIGKAEDNAKRQPVIDVARTCLVKAMDLGFIKPFSTPS